MLVQRTGPDDLDPRSRPYPLAPIPLSYNLRLLKEWGEKSGIPFWSNPVAKISADYRGRRGCVRCDTCEICPIGARYSPDLTFDALMAGRSGAAPITHFDASDYATRSPATARS